MSDMSGVSWLHGKNCSDHQRQHFQRHLYLPNHGADALRLAATPIKRQDGQLP
jgi:hypothetical protein